MAVVSINGTDYTVIRTLSDLREMALDTGNYILANNLDLEGRTWRLSVGLNVGTVLEGNGYAIYNYIPKASLFDFPDGTGDETGEIVIRNLQIGSPLAPLVYHAGRTEAAADSLTNSIGILGGYVGSPCRLEHVSVYAELSGVNCNVGGIIGTLDAPAVLTDCSFSGTASVAYTAGEGSTALGGLIAYIAKSATLTAARCANYGNLHSNANICGGLFGQVASQYLYLTDCVNYGDVECLAASAVGGIYGDLYYPAGLEPMDYRFAGCDNYGKIMGDSQVGGLFGNNNSKTNGRGGVFLLERCRNFGSVISMGSDSGGMVGSIAMKDSFTVRDCANFGSLGGEGKNKAGVCGAVNMQAGSGTYPFVVDGFLNAGHITSGSRAAGVTGWISGTFFVIRNAVNLGTLNGGSSIGGICAEALEPVFDEESGEQTVGVTVENCMNAAVLYGSGTLGNLIGGRAAQAKIGNNWFYQPRNASINTEGSPR